MLTQERLKQVLHYDPDTGVFTWAASRRTDRIGKEAGCRNTGGYIQIRVDGAFHYAHRLAWLYVTGDSPSDQLDHINGIRDDNRIVNLRVVTNRQNTENQRCARSNSRSGVKGVSWHKQCGKWTASIKSNGLQFNLGLFSTVDEAQRAYAGAAALLHTHNPHANR